MSLKLLDYTSRHCYGNLSEKLHIRFYNHSMGIRSCLLKSNFKFNLQKHHFLYVYEVINKWYLNFIAWLYFPLALIRWNSSHCHLMELFKSKEGCKEKFDSNNNWKNCMVKDDFRATSIFKIIIRICIKNVEFCRKTSR